MGLGLAVTEGLWRRACFEADVSGSAMQLYSSCMLYIISLGGSLPPLITGKTEKKEHILDERDTLFAELRHQHFAAASLRISSLMDEFRQKNKAAQV